MSPKKQKAEAGARLASAKADPFDNDDRSDIRHAFHEIKAELRSLLPMNTRTKKQVLEILKDALSEIQALKGE